MATVRGLKKRALRAKARVMPEHWVRLADGSSIRVELRDKGGLQLAVWGSGRLQPLALGAWHRLLAAQRWDLIVDVGANYGEFTVPAVRADPGSVIAIEPNPEVSACLRASIRRAGGAATICTALVGDSPRLAALSVEGNSRTARMSDRAEGLLVPVTTLDEIAGTLVAERQHESILVKVDVEGDEAAVLAGGRSLLDRYPRAALLVETLHSGWEYVAASADRFEAWGFDRESGDPVELTGLSDDALDTVSTRDILLARGLDVRRALGHR